MTAKGIATHLVTLPEPGLPLLGVTDTADKLKKRALGLA